MSRSKWKGPYIENNLLNNFNYIKNNELVTFSRSSTILHKFVGSSFKVHNGKKFINLKITENMVGFKLGEFANTRKKFVFKKKKKKKKK